MNEKNTAAPELAVRVDAGSRGLQRLVTASLLIVAAASFWMGAPSLVWIAMELSGAPLAVAVAAPLVIDVGLVVAGLCAASARAQRRPARLEMTLLFFLATSSIVSQSTHVLATASAWTWQVWVGAAFASAAPITLLLTTEAVIRDRLRSAPEPRRRPATRTAAVAPEADTARAAEPVATTAAPKRPARPAGSLVLSPVAEAGYELSPQEAVERVVSGVLTQQAAADACGLSRDAVGRHARRLRAAGAEVVTA